MLWCAIRLCVRLFVIYCLILKSDMADGKGCKTFGET